MWTTTMPAAPGWYWVRIDGEAPEVFQLVDGILWDWGRKWGIAGLKDGEVWTEPIQPPLASPKEEVMAP